MSQKIKVKSNSFLLVFWKRPSKQEYVRFWFMDHVMNPAKALLNTKSPPLLLGHQMSLWYLLCQFFWKHNMPVLILLIRVLVRVINILERHDYSGAAHHTRPTQHTMATAQQNGLSA